jgi:hypothetical protein
MKTPTQRIWVDLGGRSVCDEHLGNYASSALKKRPKAKSITTPITKWQIMPEADVSRFSKKYRKGGTLCESCQQGW